MLPSQINTDAEKQSLIDSLQQARRKARYWAKQAGVAEDACVPDPPPPPRKLPPLREHVGRQYSRARANRARIDIGRVVERLPVREQALAMDYAMRKLGPEARAAVSALPHARQEQFIGARQALEKQHDTAHTVDCRLEVPLSFDKLQQCNTFLSRRRRPDGSLDRIVVMPIPSPVHEARMRGIRTPLYAQSPFRPAQQVRDRQAELIEHDDIEVSSDGHALDIELANLAAECLAAARGQGNLRLPPLCHRPLSVCVCSICLMRIGT